MRTKYREQMRYLNNSLIEMGGIIEHNITMVVKALKEQNIELAQEVIGHAEEISAKEKEIEHLCLKLLLTQQPMAKDLRMVSAALKIITDMDRIGDQSADIAENTILLADSPYIKDLVHIPQMAEATIKMVKEAIDAFVRKDINLAVSVINYDDIVDDLFISIRNDLTLLIKQDVENCEQAFDLIMIAKYFERIGDHAVNIAKWVVFSLTGTHRYDLLD
ncbi:MAG: phosphate signaling complex protein PhoU [Peptococcaceae bacterium]|nr:phosphate signaling complex protein PhoU [Peptococcaceae bacterium]